MTTRRRLRWYLFGAQAVTLYGVVRSSADIDVTVEVPAADIPNFVDDLAKAGFRLRVSDADDFVRKTRVLPFEHTPSGWPLDVVLAGPGLEESFLGRTHRFDLGATRVAVIAPEDLVATKILAGRPKDEEDVRGLLRAGATVDRAAVRSVLAAIESALDQRDLLPAFERLAREADAPPRRR